MYLYLLIIEIHLFIYLTRLAILSLTLINVIVFLFHFTSLFISISYHKFDSNMVFRILLVLYSISLIIRSFLVYSSFSYLPKHASLSIFSTSSFITRIFNFSSVYSSMPFLFRKFIRFVNYILNL